MTERRGRAGVKIAGQGHALTRISPARQAAFAILQRVETSNAHSDDLLHGPGMAGLSQADRNLATTLVLGVLRWQIALDVRLRSFLQRPDVALASPVAIALRMGAFQLLHLDRIPAHAALSESVEMVRAAGQAHAAGMVNAVLRKLTQESPPRPKLYESTEALAERLAHPGWLVERWVREYGRAAALAVCEYDQRPPAQGGLFAVRDGLAISEDQAESTAESGTALPHMLPHMDDGSRLVAELAAASQPGARRIWDCCAAPGGKTIVLARRLPAAQILASDVNPRRVQALAERLRNTAPGVRALEADAIRLPAAEGEFDLVVCDVPCSGTGTLARNPEIKERLKPEDLARQAQRQREILAAALRRVAAGGRLLYSTCSLEPEENERVIEAVLAEAPDGPIIRRVPVEPMIQELRERGIINPEAPLGGSVRQGSLRTLPGSGFEGDGFFATVLARA